MKIVFFGDSITDAYRDRETDTFLPAYGEGYVRDVAGKLLSSEPDRYEIFNRGISGDRSVDLYARIKKDVWNLAPDVLSIFVGVNDVWHELWQNGVDIKRFERVYKMMIEDTLERLPNVKIMLVEPFALKGSATRENWDNFVRVKDYAEVVKNLAKEYGAYFVETQRFFDGINEKFKEGELLLDGVHPNVAGSASLAEQWLNVFYKMQKKA